MTIYRPDAIEKKARTAAKADGKSVSRWIADQLVQHLDDTWSQAVLDAAGSIPDFPDLESFERATGLTHRGTH